MTDPVDLTAREDAVRRLREMHDAADDADRPRAALYVGLASADLIDLLPEGDRRRGKLATDALALLDPDSPEHTDLAERLRSRLSAEPESVVELAGGDLNWDVDWAALRRPAESAKGVLDMLPFMASMLPPQAPVRQALTSITEVIQAFERGQWTPERDRSLKTAIEQIETGGLGAGLAMILRLIAMTIRVRRCQQTADAGGQPQWPSLDELDDLVEGLKLAADLGDSLGAPFQAIDGLHHMYIAVAISLRLSVDTKQTDVVRDSAWRGNFLRLLDQADEHLRQLPPAYAGLAQDLRGKLGGIATTLRTGAAPSAAGRKTKPAPAPPSPAAPPSASPSGPELTGLLGDPATVGAWDNLEAMTQFSARAFDGLKILTDAIDDPVAKGIGGMLNALGAINSRRWTPENEQRLAELERQTGVPAGNLAPAQRFVLAAMLAIMHAGRYHQRSTSPRSADHPPVSELAAVIAEIEAALETGRAVAASGAGTMATEVSAILQAQVGMLLVDLSALDQENRSELLARARAHFDQVPAEMKKRLPVIGNLAVLEEVIEGRIEPDDEAVKSVIAMNPDAWDRSGSALKPALAASDRARRSQQPEDIGAALLELQAVWVRLSAGNPMRSRVLVPIAMQRCFVAARTGHEQTAVDAASTAVAGLAAAVLPAERDAAAQLTVNLLMQQLNRGQFGGPFRELEEAARGALTGLGSSDWALRVSLLTAVGAAMTMRSYAQSDETLRAAAQQVIAEAARLLPEPELSNPWFGAARLLFAWTGVHGVTTHDAESSATALRLADSLESVLARSSAAANPASAADGGDSLAAVSQGISQLREQLIAVQGQEPVIPPVPSAATEARRQAALRALDRAVALLHPGDQDTSARRPFAPAALKDPEALRAVSAELHQALADITDDAGLRRRIHQTLGICHAELYWAESAERTEATLQEAVAHLNHALTADAHATPTVDWADALQYLGRCEREVPRWRGDSVGPGTAERTMRAALRELARCVMTAETDRAALDAAAAANEIVARTVSWCVADDRHRAAIDIAEAGRGLVLASVVMSGRVGEVLRGAGQSAAADAWRAGGAADRATALNALWDTPLGEQLLSSPIGPEISVAMSGMRFDAIVYLVPPAAPDSASQDTAAEPAGHAIFLRPVLGEVEVVPLPGLSAAAEGGTPLGAYLAALDGALGVTDPRERGVDGFRGGPHGRAWADALDELGFWTYQRIVGPLLEHVRTWSLNREPYLVLVPLGELGAIPYAAAWTDDPVGAERGGRRYALDDLVLSYAASARLLAEVARRPPQPLGERVVLVTSPRGEHPMTRRATRTLAARTYPGAEVYGLKSERNGPATVSALLGALPRGDRAGASLLQLSTHGTSHPVPALQARDGWLPLTSILEQARDRASDAPGGLVITNACLTDRTQGHYDESLTLATGFLAAGATAVIGTRWPIDDDTAAALSLRLHLHLQTGHEPAEALRRAQLDLLRPTADMRASLGPDLAAVTDDRLRHPATWAGHVHHGSWSSRPDEQKEEK